jgi:tetrahydromethanopterin S-methyltransferase subunit C
MTAANEKRGTLAVLALIFGIAAIIISWVPFVNFLSILLAIAAMILGVIEIRRIDTGKTPAIGKSFAITGIILGAVAVVLGIVLSFILRLLVGGIWGFYNLNLF